MARNSVLVLRLIERLGRGEAMGLTELSQALLSPKTSVHRAVADLVEEGWVRSTGQVPPRYFLTGKVLRAAQGVNGMTELSVVAEPLIDELHRTTGENVQLSTLDDGYILALARRESTHALRVHLPIGERVPWHATAAGRAIAGHLPPEGLERLLAGDLPALTPDTITDRETLRRDIQLGVDQGYVVNRSGWRVGVVSIGAAVLDARGFAVAGLSVNGVETRMTPELVATVARSVRDAADRISAELTAAGPHTSWSGTPTAKVSSGRPVPGQAVQPRAAPGWGAAGNWHQ